MKKIGLISLLISSLSMSAFAEEMVITPPGTRQEIGIPLKTACEAFNNMGLKDGDSVIMMAVQSKLATFPPGLLTPNINLDAWALIEPTTRVTFHCTKIVGQDNLSAKVFLTYQDSMSAKMMTSPVLLAHYPVKGPRVSPCAGIEKTLGWSSGELITPTDFVTNISSIPKDAVVTPANAIADLIALKGASSMYFHCTNVPDNKNESTIYFTYTKDHLEVQSPPMIISNGATIPDKI